MKEQSHKSEMGAALRGDFERLRARRQDGGEAPPDGARPEPVVLLATPSAELGVNQVEPAAVKRPDAAPARAQRQSWLDRLRNRY